MEVIGFDLSLTATGVAYRDGRGVLSSKARGMERLDDLESRLLRLATSFPDPLVVIEGYSFGSKGRAVYGIAELGGGIRLGLWRADIPYVAVAPAALKKFATGKGNANKDEVLSAAIRRWGYEGANNNEADAHILRMMGMAAFAAPDDDDPLPQYAQEALAKVEWPKMRSLLHAP